MVQEKDLAQPLRSKALEFLSRREYGTQELGRKLQSKGYSCAAVETVLGELSREGLISDERYAESSIHSYVHRGYGPLRILRELQRRGVEDSASRTHLEKYQDEWRERAIAARHKRFGVTKPEDFREWARQARFLEYRGFTTEQIRFALGDEY
ncbi:MAG: regulatory protein RecX [Gammaproteobacteria bacterium]|nr:regulatory protein RecX [Gammaproteobacteria bacterium]